MTKPKSSPKPARIAAELPIPKATTKIDVLVSLLHRPEGATIDVMQAATGWQAHSVRGAIAGSIKKKLNFLVASEKASGGRVYRIVGKADL